MAYTLSEIATNIVDDYTRRYVSMWLSEYDTGASSDAKWAKLITKVNADRAEVGLPALPTGK